MSGVLQVLAASGTVKRVQLFPSNAYLSGPTGPVTAIYSVNSNGTVTGNNVTQYSWLLVGSASDYEVRATLSSGTTPSSGTLNTWQGLGTSRSWSQTQTGPGVGTRGCVLGIEIRLASSGTVLASDSVEITAEVTGE